MNPLLAVVVDQATWAFHAGYGKSGRGLDAPRGRALDPRDTGEDNVGRPGEIDLEIGDSRARQAYQAACRLVGVGIYAAPAELTAAARRADPDPVAMREVAYLLEQAVGGPFEPPVLCTTCRSRPPATRLGPNGPRLSSAGECATCARWRERHGCERPVKLDGIGVARDAQVRRLKRGESFGAG